MRRLICMMLALSSSLVSAHEPEEMVTLRAANDALTLRVAQLLEENSRLQEFAEKALIAQSKGESVSIGCDPQDLRRTLVESNQAVPSVAKEWLKKNADNCSKQDLEYLSRNVSNWTSYAFGEVVRLVDYYTDQK